MCEDERQGRVWPGDQVGPTGQLNSFHSSVMGHPENAPRGGCRGLMPMSGSRAGCYVESIVGVQSWAAKTLDSSSASAQQLHHEL